MSEYEAQADKFCETYGLKVSAAFKGDGCPPWEQPQDVPGTCPECHNTHGDRYRVTLRWKDQARRPRSLTFDFWGSFNDMQNNKRPTAYDVLKTAGCDVHCPDTFEDFCGQYGYDQDSRTAERTFRRCDNFAQRLRAFFTEEEQEAVATIA